MSAVKKRAAAEAENAVLSTDDADTLARKKRLSCAEGNGCVPAYPALYGNDTLLCVVRLHASLFARIRRARELAHARQRRSGVKSLSSSSDSSNENSRGSSPENVDRDSESSNSVEDEGFPKEDTDAIGLGEEAFHRWLRRLLQLAVGEIKSDEFEQASRELLGASAFVVFTMERLLQQLMFHTLVLNGYVADGAGAPSNALARAKKGICDYMVANLLCREAESTISTTRKNSTSTDSAVAICAPYPQQWPLKMLRDPSNLTAEAYALASMEHEIEVVKSNESDVSESGDSSSATAKSNTSNSKGAKNAANKSKRVTRRSEAAVVQTLQHVSMWHFARRHRDTGCIEVRDALSSMASDGILSEGIVSALALGAEDEDDEVPSEE
jgi:hypothetical protein